MRVQVSESLADLVGYAPRHRLREWLKVMLMQVLLEVTTRHNLHDDAMHIFNCELFFESDDVGTVLTAGLKLNLILNLLLLTLIIGARWQNFHRKLFIRVPMTGQHDLTESTVTQLLNQIILV